MIKYSVEQLENYFKQKLQFRFLLEILGAVIAIYLALSVNYLFLTIAIFMFVMAIFDVRLLTGDATRILYKQKLFQKYGTPQKISEKLLELEELKIFQNHRLTISEYSIMLNNKPETFTKLDDILIIWPENITRTEQNKTRNSGYRLIWYNIYGEKQIITFPEQERREVEEIFSLLYQNAKYAHFGQVDDLNNYLCNRIIPLPKHSLDANSENISSKIKNIPEAKVVSNNHH